MSGANKRCYFCCPHLHVGDLVLLPLVPLHLVLQQLPACLHVAVVVALTIHKHNINNSVTALIITTIIILVKRHLRLVEFHHQTIMWLSSSTTRLSCCARLVLQWTPMHCGIQGHDKADRTAKLSAGKKQEENKVTNPDTKTPTQT